MNKYSLFLQIFTLRQKKTTVIIAQNYKNVNTSEIRSVSGAASNAYSADPFVDFVIILSILLTSPKIPENALWA